MPHLTFSRQRVPMIDASTLEDRTRPVLDRFVAARLRYFAWPTWRAEYHQPPTGQALPSVAKLGRR